MIYFGYLVLITFGVPNENHLTTKIFLKFNFNDDLQSFINFSGIWVEKILEVQFQQ